MVMVLTPAANKTEMASLPEAPPSLLKSADCPKKVDFAELRPVDVGEAEFAVGALPEQETG